MRVLGPSLLLPGNDARWLPNVDLPAEGLIWCWHLAPSSVGRDCSDCDSDVGGDVRCCPPFGVGSRHGHPSDFTAQFCRQTLYRYRVCLYRWDVLYDIDVLAMAGAASRNVR